MPDRLVHRERVERHAVVQKFDGESLGGLFNPDSEFSRRSLVGVGTYIHHNLLDGHIQMSHALRGQALLCSVFLQNESPEVAQAIERGGKSPLPDGGFHSSRPPLRRSDDPEGFLAAPCHGKEAVEA